MKIKLQFTLLFVFSISVFTSLNAQSVYKRKLDVNQDTISSQNKNSYSYGSYKFDKKNSVKASLISPFFNILSVFYTRYLDQESALQFGFSLMSDYKYSNGSDSRAINGQALTIEYRYNLRGNHSNCSYIQPFTRIINGSADAKYSKSDYYWDQNAGKYITTEINQSYSETCLSAGVGFLLGVQNTVKNKLVFDVYAGPVYSFHINNSSTRPAIVPEYTNRGSLQDLVVKGYGIRAGLCIGFLF